MVLDTANAVVSYAVSTYGMSGSPFLNGNWEMSDWLHNLPVIRGSCATDRISAVLPAGGVAMKVWGGEREQVSSLGRRAGLDTKALEPHGWEGTRRRWEEGCRFPGRDQRGP